MSTFLNPGVSIQSPQTRGGLNLTSGGNARTYTLTAAGPEAEADPDLGTAASLRWPKFGNSVAIVNQKGQSKNANSLKQTMTIGAGDIDSVDGLAHVRFVLAPVLQDPGHNPDEQPYFFVQLTNLTKGNSILYQDFNFANQPGVPWKQGAGGSIRYTDWTLVDIAPGSAKLAPNDQVELEVIAAGCSLNGHWGHVYVDGAGTGVPSLFVSATGPSSANQDTDITYTLTYTNGGAAGAGGTVVSFNTPPFTTFSSFNAPGLTCTAPNAGTTGTVTCNIGTVPAGASGSFTVTTHIDNGTAGNVVTAGNYDIKGNGVSPLLGPKVYTNITNNVTYANLGVAFQPGGPTTVAAGGTVTYVFEVTNAGPNDVSGAPVIDNLPPQLTGATWTCSGTGGATCTGAGVGSINDAATSIPVGGKLTYTVTATVDPAAPAGQLGNVASVSVPGGASDPDPSNNSVGDYKQITVANGVACAAPTDCTSGACNAGDSKCGYPNDAGPCTLANAGVVCRSGACSASGTCMPPGGCNVDVDCSSGNWCSISTHTCTAKVGNGGDLPNDPPHTTPPLDGTCTVDAATLTCLSGVCDNADDKCGYADGTGPCTTASAAVVCRSGSCSANGVCKAADACNVDADCSAGNWCNMTAHACAPKVTNGGAVPTDAAHTSPTLDGKCSDDAATLTCASAVCDKADDKCGYADGNGPCTSSNAGVVCRSGSCSSTGVCKPATACNVDQDCNTSSEFCDTGTHACTPKLTNGTPVPTVAGHTPAIAGACTAEVGGIVCASAVCDSTDNKCGYGNGNGPCTAEDGATVCRAGVCDTKDGKCGLLDGDGPCASDSACRAGTCNATTHTCGTAAPPASGCKTDADCESDAFCAAGGTCTPKQIDGATCAGDNQCKSGACNDALCDTPYAVGNGIGCAVGSSSNSGASTGAGTFGLGFVAVSLLRRRRRNAARQ